MTVDRRFRTAKHESTFDEALDREESSHRSCSAPRPLDAYDVDKPAFYGFDSTTGNVPLDAYEVRKLKKPGFESGHRGIDRRDSLYHLAKGLLLMECEAEEMGKSKFQAQLREGRNLAGMFTDKYEFYVVREGDFLMTFSTPYAGEESERIAVKLDAETYDRYRVRLSECCNTLYEMTIFDW